MSAAELIQIVFWAAVLAAAPLVNKNLNSKPKDPR